MRHFIRNFPSLWRASRLARRWYLARRGAYPDWSAAISADRALWDSARNAAQGGPRVLMATAIGSYAHAVTLESALAAALTFRGAEVHALLCDGTMTACAECEASLYPNLRDFAEHGPSRDLCRDCRWPAERVYAQLGITVHRMGDWLTPADRADARRIASSLPLDQIEDFTLDGLAIGEHAHAGALRFFATGSLDREPQAEAILRRYLESALLTAFATRRLMRDVRISSAVFTHGIYVPWGIVGEVARQEGVHVSNWNVAYRKRRFIFSHGDTYHHTLLNEPREHWEDLDLSAAQERELMQYLASRREGMFDWIVFHRATKQDPQEIAKTIGLDPSRPAIGLLTNVAWDAQLHYPANAFPNMLEWLVQTCEYFATRPDLQLLIRVHPAEISGFPPSRQPILAELRTRLPRLAPNIIVVPPESGLEHVCADVALQLGDHLRHEDGRGADERRAAGDRRGRGVDPQQGDHARCDDAGRVFPAARAAAVRRAPCAAAAVARAPVRVSLLLQPHDPAAVHRAESRLSDLPAEARSAAAAAARRFAGPGYDLRRHPGRAPFVLRDKGRKTPAAAAAPEPSAVQ